MEEKLKSIKSFVASVSGVLHNNQDIIGVLDGKSFNGLLRSHYDGQGVSLLRAIGIKVIFVGTEPVSPADPILGMIQRWNNLPSSSKVAGDGGWPLVELINGVVGTEQVVSVGDCLNKFGLSFIDCAVMGHDLVQVPLLRMASFKVVPAQAEEVVKQMADFITSRHGGNGALRDFANLVIKARGIDPTTLPTR